MGGVLAICYKTSVFFLLVFVGARVAGVAGRVVGLIEGRLAAQGSFEAVSRDATGRRLYLGEGQEAPEGEGTAHA